MSLTLRPFRLTDVDDFMQCAGDHQVMQFMRWDTLTSIQEALSFIKDVCIPHPWCRSICIDDRSIGYITAYPDSGDDRCKAYVGYALAREYWGQGISTRALKMAIPQVFKSLPDVVRLEALVLVHNIASPRVLEKVGFKKEGVLRKYRYVKGEISDFVVLSLLSNECDANGGV